MRIDYDRQVDAAYITLRPAQVGIQVAKTVPLDPTEIDVNRHIERAKGKGATNHLAMSVSNDGLYDQHVQVAVEAGLAARSTRRG